MTPALDNDRVRQLLATQFPDVASDRVTFLGEGCDNWAFDVNDRWVFRFPKRPDVERQLLIEARVLTLLQPRAPLPIPSYRFVGESSPQFPYHFTGYVKLPGVSGIGLDWTPAELERLAPLMARFLNWLHGVDATPLNAEGLELVTAQDVLAELQSDALSDLRLVREMAPDAPAAVWEQFLSSDIRSLFPVTPHRALIHHDLAAEHVLVDPATRTITGVIDWSDMAIGDPAVDFSGLFHWGGAAFVDEVLTHVRASRGRRLQTPSRLPRRVPWCARRGLWPRARPPRVHRRRPARPPALRTVIASAMLNAWLPCPIAV